MAKVLYLVANPFPTQGTIAKVWAIVNASKHISYIATPFHFKTPSLASIWRSGTLLYRPSRTNILSNVIYLYPIIKRENIEIIHVFFPSELFVASILKVLIPSLKIIRSFEGCVDYRPLIRVFTNICLYNTDHCIFISEYVRKFFSRLKIRGNCSIIYNCAVHISDNPVLKFPSVPLQLLTLSGLNKNKNLFLLIEVARILHERGVKFCLKIAGDGDLKTALQHKISEYHLDNMVCLLGQCNNVIELLDESDIYLHPAQNEGFGIAVVEAMARKRPVIVSNCGGLIEIVNNGENGYVCSWNNPIEWADTIERISENNIQDVVKNAYNDYKEKYTPFIFVNNVDKLIDSTLAAK